jgi:thiamine-monophosphate kinase
MERELIAWLKSRIQHHPHVRRGIGDDCAILHPSPASEFVVTTDMLMDRVDFLWGTHDPLLIGRKCLAVNLSDLAAMGARPIAAFVSLAIPKSFSIDSIQSLMQGMLDLVSEYEFEIAGGDTNTHDGALVVSVTAIGAAPVGQAWTRDGAKPGDRLLVTGPLGGSLLEHQFTFTPRVREALAWREVAEIHAAIDISDGFALDLSRLLEASKCGAVIDESRLPISDAARRMSVSGSGRTLLEHALGDGEDFELILAAAPDQADRLVEYAKRNGQSLIDVGEVTEARNIVVRTTSGAMEPLAITGFVHRLDA